MCTISSVAAGHKMIFTFNRDEHPERNALEFLAIRQLPNKTIYFPRDPRSGGSWLATDSLGNLAMLFNGAFKKHEKKETYATSRGALLLEIVSGENILETFSGKNLDQTEPFSMLLYENKKLFRLTWTGTGKCLQLLPKNKNHIFSSATIYTDPVKETRAAWLAQFAKHNRLHEQSLFHFHKNSYPEDSENGLVINRNNRLRTVSISQVTISNTKTKILHEDLLKNQLHHSTINHEPVCY